MDRTVLPLRNAAENRTPAEHVQDQKPPHRAPEPTRPPGGAPNVLLILMDDMGFGAPLPFGGPCRMPTADRLASGGLRYSRFHTTALCAPTRAALLTGRNHHSVGMGGLPELATAAPGYTSIRPDSAATIARILRGNGYKTAAFGKMHQTPIWETTAAGPFERWPTGEGFEKFYGFFGAETNQFSPNLVDGVTRIDQPKTPEQGYHLSEDLVDQSIRWIDAVSTVDPGSPWFCYLSFGAAHAPYHVPQEWRDRYRGEFSHGWTKQREQTLARQKALGVVPQDAELAPWSPGVPKWDDLDETQKASAERHMEIYAAFVEHADFQTGRLIDALDRLGQLNETLVLYVLGDNGASPSGGLEGTFNMAARINGLPEAAEQSLEALDELGGPGSSPSYPVGWALAMDTPYQWTKQVASHYGGTRNGLIVHWPSRVTAAGEVRHQWAHCIDVAPTILEAAGLPEPWQVDGVTQKPMEGVSFGYTFDDADAAERHTTQYFELCGNRGIYHNGWTAVTKHRTPWSLRGDGTHLPELADDEWELYDTNSDWTQSRDVADLYPDQLAKLQQLFVIEAARHDVLPIDDRYGERLDPKIAGRRDVFGCRGSVELRPHMDGLQEAVAPNVKNTSFCVTADVVVDDRDTDGVIVAQGGRFGGWSLYLREGRLTYCHNLCGVRTTYIRSDQALMPGRHRLQMRFYYDGGGIGKGGKAVLAVDGGQVQEGRLDQTTPVSFSVDETLDIGVDRQTRVTDEYPSYPMNRFPGEVGVVRIDVGEDMVPVPPREWETITLFTH
ncbi:arylsulfatase [Qaidamihabitans albus]|uniref:arylsulfatase n=1 Tax=Qaidamihabitans albus TaxID=2795733 RepID=UPI0018F202C5|nr:arylsulfatase [Qaidamihabitans albus]